MAQGKPTKWARVSINQPMWLNKTGLEIVVWDKWGRKRKGTLVVSIGGLRWFLNKKHKAPVISWDRLVERLS
jgi:hypothetical protein